MDSQPMYHIISQPSCVWCDKAKLLLKFFGYEYTEEVLTTPEQKAAFRAAGHTTVPQIWHGDRHVGGFNDLDRYLSQD